MLLPHCRCAPVLIVLAAVTACSVGAQDAPAPDRLAQNLTVKELVQRVIDRNEALQARLLEYEASRRRYSAEKGIFEPDLTGSVSHERNSRLNTVEQQRATLSDSFSETNNLYAAGIESLVPTGAKLRLGYSLRDLNNNLQGQPSFASRGATNGEYQSFMGFTLTQPLLKNGWFAATLAGIRIAALSSAISFQNYRRQLMIAISTAEATYWNLYLVQEQVKFFAESVRTAQTVLDDANTRLKAGIGSETDVWEAQSGLALRQSKLADAHQRRFESANRVMALYADNPTRPGSLVRAVDAPELDFVPPALPEMGQTARQRNPDYLAQELRARQEGLKLSYAKNQRLPELNLNGAYGLNGLGSNPGYSWDAATSDNYPAWMVGLELRIPILGGIKGRNLVSAARLSEQQAQVELSSTETEILTSLDNGLHKLRSAQTNIASYQTIVTANENLVKSALARFEAGKVDSRRVLEFEGDLLEARTSVVEAMVQFQRAILEMQLIEGSTLWRRQLELTQADLSRATRKFIQKSRITPATTGAVVADLNQEFAQNRARQKTPAASAPGRMPQEPKVPARPAAQPAPQDGVSPADYERMRAALREQVRAAEQPAGPAPQPASSGGK
jgi:outer membrane protein TolC